MGLFSFYELGEAERVGEVRTLARQLPTASQLELAARLELEVLAWTRLPIELATVGSSGRPPRLHEVARRVTASAYSADDLSKLVATALPVRANRVALPTAAGQADPSAFLSAPRRRQFVDWKWREALKPDIDDGVRGRHRTSAVEEVKLLRRLCAAKMGNFYSAAEIRSARAKQRGDSARAKQLDDSVRDSV